MSSELDLSFFIAALRRRWWIVLLCVLAALALALVLGMRQAQRYDASNTLLVQSPRYQWRFDNSITAITDQRRDFQREILAIARSDEIARNAAAALEAAGLTDPVSPAALQSAIMVRAGDGNTIVVTATATDPARAAAYASAWTEQLIASARDVYGAVQDLTSFQTELAEQQGRLQQMDEALAQARARTGLYSVTDPRDDAMRSSVTSQQLNLVNATLAQYLVDLGNLRYLREQLSQAAAGSDLTQLPWELLAGPVLSQRGVISPEIARANLNDRAGLESLLDQEEAALQATVDGLSSQADQAQMALAADWQDYERILRERNQVRDTYLILLRKVTELALQERVDPSLLSIVGSVEPLVTPVGAPLTALLVTAGVAGLLVGTLLAVWVEARNRRSISGQPDVQATGSY